MGKTKVIVNLAKENDSEAIVKSETVNNKMSTKFICLSQKHLNQLIR